MTTKYGVSDGTNVVLVTDLVEEALTSARGMVQADGKRRYVVKIVPLKRVTSTALPPPDPLVEDE